MQVDVKPARVSVPSRLARPSRVASAFATVGLRPDRPKKLRAASTSLSLSIFTPAAVADLSFTELYRCLQHAMAAEDRSKFAIHEACREGRSMRWLLPHSSPRLADVLRSCRR